MPKKRVAIVQSNYIPWKGYFDMIAAVDEFILYDDMQYTKRDWRNRNLIKTAQGVQWLTVPVKVAGRYHQRIRDTEIDGTAWAESHWKALTQNYRRAPYYETVAPFLEPLYLDTHYSHLSQLNRKLIEFVCGQLGIATKISNSWDYKLIEGKTERIVDLCVQAEAHEYCSGPAARSYLDESPFREKGISVSWFDYSGYPVYPQLWGTFVHEVSVLDLLFNCGEAAAHYMQLSARDAAGRLGYAAAGASTDITLDG